MAQQSGKVDMARSSVEKVDMAQQRGKSRHGAAMWKEKNIAHHLGKVDIVQHFGKSRHGVTVWEKETKHKSVEKVDMAQ